MALESKQHADLVRHRELNALRRLMVQRGKTETLVGDDAPSQQSSAFASSKAIGKIDALEAQMNQQLFDQNAGVNAEADGFQLTQIQAFDSAAKTTQSMPTQAQGPSTVQLAGEQFANGKTQAALNMLEQAIGERGLQEGRIPMWLALFDLYRACDLMDRFEALALDFSIRFGRSPPPWISLPQQAAIAEREHDGASAQDSGGINWSAPAKLAQKDLFGLEAAVQAGTDAIGFVFAPSVRRVSAVVVIEISCGRAFRPHITCRRRRGLPREAEQVLLAGRGEAQLAQHVA